MKWIWIILIPLLFIGCYDGTPYPTHLEGHIVEKHWIQIDSIRNEYWGKIAIQTEWNNVFVLNVDLHTYLILENYDYVSIVFKKNGDIKHFAYGKRKDK